MHHFFSFVRLVIILTMVGITKNRIHKKKEVSIQ